MKEKFFVSGPKAWAFLAAVCEAMAQGSITITSKRGEVVLGAIDAPNGYSFMNDVHSAWKSEDVVLNRVA